MLAVLRRLNPPDRILQKKNTQKKTTTKNKLKRAIYYIISNHSLVAIFKTLGSALLTILIK